MTTIYISLKNEGTEVWRPVEAIDLGDGTFRVDGSVPEDETWKFQPGETVRVREMMLSGAKVLVAMTRA